MLRGEEAADVEVRAVKCVRSFVRCDLSVNPGNAGNIFWWFGVGFENNSVERNSEQ
jgi:hypothetical protein